VIVQRKIGRSATTNPLDEHIDRYQSIGWTSRSEAGMLYISQRAPLDLLLAECHGEEEGRDSFAGSKRSSY
jgi:hypothetical protein